jgi:M-phase inducer tyrosine phosphatase
MTFPSDNPCKLLHKPNYSAMVPPSDAAQFMQPPIALQDEVLLTGQSTRLPPPHRAFSAMLLPPGPSTRSSNESSIEYGNESSPVLAYAKQQQIRTICRCNGTDNFCCLKGVTSMVACDKESPHARMVPEWGMGLGGFGDNEAHGKVLPCH